MVVYSDVMESALQVVGGVETKDEGQRCKFYGYTPAGGAPDTLKAAQRIIAQHYPDKAPAVSELAVSPTGSLALRNIISLLVDSEREVYVVGEQPLTKSMGQLIASRGGVTQEVPDVNKFLASRVSYDTPAVVFVDSRSLDADALGKLQDKLQSDRNLVVVDVHQHEDLLQRTDGVLCPFLLFDGVDASSVITVDAHRDDLYPAIVSGPAAVISRFGARQMVATAGMDFMSQLLLRQLAQYAPEIPEEVLPLRGDFSLPLFAEHVRALKQVPIREILMLHGKAQQELGVVIPNASIGQPDSVSICPNIMAEWLGSLSRERYEFDEGDRKPGIRFVREQVAKEANSRYAASLSGERDFSPSDVVVTYGANGALYASARALVEQDLYKSRERTYVLLAPHFSSYRQILMEAGVLEKNIKMVKCGDDLLPDLDDFDRVLKLAGENVTILDNDPSNPMGVKRSTAFNQRMSDVISQFVKPTDSSPSKNIIIFNDDPYYGLCHQGRSGEYKSLHEILPQSKNLAYVHMFSGSKELVGGPASRCGVLVAHFMLDDDRFSTLAADIHARDCGSVHPAMQLLLAKAIELKEAKEVQEWDAKRIEQYRANNEVLVAEAAKTEGRVKVIGSSEHAAPAAFYAAIELDNSILGLQVPDSIEIGDKKYEGLRGKVFGPDADSFVLADQLQVMKLMVALGAGAAVPLFSFGVEDESWLLYRAALGGNEDVARNLVVGFSETVGKLQELSRKQDFEAWRADIAGRQGEWSSGVRKIIDNQSAVGHQRFGGLDGQNVA